MSIVILDKITSDLSYMIKKIDGANVHISYDISDNISSMYNVIHMIDRHTDRYGNDNR